MKLSFKTTVFVSCMFATVVVNAQTETERSATIDTTAWYNQLQQLDEVVIKSTMPKVRTTASGTKIAVTGSVLENLGNSKDVLSHLPMVKSVDEGVEIFGRGNADIYVNGRRLYDNSELDQIPSDQIVSVEIISNPGARYPASTRAVVLIKIKRPQGEGWGFRDELRAGTLAGLYGRNQLDVNYRDGGLDLGGTLTGNATRTHIKAIQEIETATGGKLLKQSMNKTDNVVKYQTFEAGLKANYIFNEDNAIGARYNFMRTPYLHSTFYSPSVFTLDGEEIQQSISNLSTRKPTYSHIANAYYSSKVGQWQLDANLDGVWIDTRDETSTDEEIRIPGQAAVLDHVNAFTHSNSRMYAGKLVVTHPLLGGLLSLGTEYDNTHRTEESLNPKTGNGESKVDEGIFAGFAEYNAMLFQKLSLNAGLRYEKVTSDYYEFGQHKMDRNYDDLFPSIGLAMPVGQVQLGGHYGVDITRPSFSNLSGNTYFINTYTYQSGNPNLKPTYSHNLSLTASWRWFMFQADYSRVKDEVAIENSTYSQNDELITLIRPNNMKAFNRYNLQFFAQPTFFKIWYPAWGFVVTGQNYEYTRADGTLHKMNKPIFTAIWNNMVMLPSGWRLGADLRYQSAGDYSTYHLHNSSLRVNASVQKSFCRGRLDTKLAANNITGASQATTIYGTRNLYSKSDSPTNVELTLTYKFNLGVDKYKGRGAGEKVKSRIQ